MQRGCRYGELLRQRAGHTPADADLPPLLAHMLTPAQAAAAGAAAEHGVAHDTAAEPGGIDTVSDRRHPPGPLVARPHRVGGVALVEIGHRAGEELRVRAAHTDSLDIDDDLTGAGHRRRKLLDLVRAGTGQDERAHHATAHHGRDSPRRQGGVCLCFMSSGI
ncbi:hypothetical protein SVIOM74S_10140 [Streptomyces violarus]